jgi:hypothetical protein
MDINTIKAIRNSLNVKETDINKPQGKKLVKKDAIKGCLKLADYMAF